MAGLHLDDLDDLEPLVAGREVLIVANRLPVEWVSEASGDGHWRTSPGGLVTALSSVGSALKCTWVGWPGAGGTNGADGNADGDLDSFIHEGLRLVAVPLTDAEVNGYYLGFANSVLWPIHHDLTEWIETNNTDSAHNEAADNDTVNWWREYRAVNQKFARRVAACAEPRAIVWVQDYHLQLVPALLRSMRPDLTVLFFLHIPFPLPATLTHQAVQREQTRQLLRGMLGADIVGLQREFDLAQLRAALCEHGLAERPGQLHAFPISIDPEPYAEIAQEPATLRRAERWRDDLGVSEQNDSQPRRLLLGVDRLDYTKGIVDRLEAFAALLEQWPATPDEPKPVLAQVLTLTREGVAAYQELRRQVEARVAEINSRFGSAGYTPVVNLFGNFTREQLVELYLAADVLCITSPRDGMNLVAKEYVAARGASDEHSRSNPNDGGPQGRRCGVLVLSRGAGAADELGDAIHYQPHSKDALVEAMWQACQLPPEEACARMSRMRRVVRANDVARWAATMLRAGLQAGLGAVSSTAIDVTPIAAPSVDPNPAPDASSGAVTDSVGAGL